MARLVKMTGDDKPANMTIEMNNNTPIFAAINANIEPYGDGYVWDALVLPEFALTNIYNADKATKYKVLVSHIIKAYYTDGDVTAVLANYMVDPDNAKYKTEFDELQACRKMAKNLANNIVNTGMF